jgi:hypothetical protein
MIPEYPPIPNESSIECDSELTEFEFEFYEDLNYFFTLIIDNGK